MFGAFQDYSSAPQDATLWAILGLVWICIAVVFRSKSGARGNR